MATPGELVAHQLDWERDEEGLAQAVFEVPNGSAGKVKVCHGEDDTDKYDVVIEDHLGINETIAWNIEGPLTAMHRAEELVLSGDTELEEPEDEDLGGEPINPAEMPF